MARRAPVASVTVGPGGRILALSAAWFSDGARRRAEARRAARCVECGRELPSHRTPYCSRRCRWRFHGHYFWDSARSYVLLRDRYVCQVCGTKHRARELDVDHVIEIARGGAALEYSNLQTVCRPCHRAKTAAFRRVRSPRTSNEPSRFSGEGDEVPARDEVQPAVEPALPTSAARASTENGRPVPVR